MPGTAWVKVAMSVIGWLGSTPSCNGKLVLNDGPVPGSSSASLCFAVVPFTSSGTPASADGCSTTYPVRAVRNSVCTVAMLLACTDPIAPPAPAYR